MSAMSYEPCSGVRGIVASDSVRRMVVQVPKTRWTFPSLLLASIATQPDSDAFVNTTVYSAVLPSFESFVRKQSVLPAGDNESRWWVGSDVESVVRPNKYASPAAFTWTRVAYSSPAPPKYVAKASCGSTTSGRVLSYGPSFKRTAEWRSVSSYPPSTVERTPART